MSITRYCAPALALALLAVAPTPVLAAAPKGAAKPTAKEALSPPNFDAMMGIVDKLFPPQPDPDPERLALARTSVQAMWPDGAYGKMMTGFVGGMFDRAMQLKGSDFEQLGPAGKKKETDADAEDVTIHDAVAAKDPYFDQRVAAMRDVITEEVGKISAIIDPRMRDGLARAMARRFDARQLAEINSFFATPSGHAFADQYMQLWLDADTIRSIFGGVPEMMKLMPEMMDKVKAANDKFPKPPKSPKSPKSKKAAKH